VNDSDAPGQAGPAPSALDPGGVATPARAPLTLLICALGGEGGGRLTQWIVEAARLADHPAQATSVPGVAQRTGSTTYYVEVWPEPHARLGSRRPVFCLSPVPGALDGLLASELLEGSRAIAQGYASAERTLVLGSVSRTLTTIERMQPADGRLDGARLEQLVASASREHHLFDMSALARECGTAVSAVMLGALAGSGLLPLSRAHYEAAVRADGADATASLRGFARGFEHVQRAREAPAPAGSEVPEGAAGSGTAAAPPLPEPWRSQLPAAAQPWAALGVQRLREYQDEAYALRYLQRLARIAQAERTGDPASTQPGAATAETARWLALWMAFDDVVRVADLKSRAARWARVAREVQAGPSDVLRIYDHFKPGLPELAGLLPPALARRLLAWDARRVARGRTPWALPVKLRTHTVTGLMALRAMAALKRLRPLGSRFALEQSLIERWLAGIEAGLPRDPALGLEIARCGRLVKGYGSTNERGKDNLMHVLVHLSQGPDAQAAAAAVRAAREAALADDTGRSLDQALVAQGAPPRPVKEQPIRFVRRAPQGARRQD
jgi:indolepyruvate ferredoxin oxidoreductase beta subunit